MDELELTEKIERLAKKKKGLERNRTLCVLLAAFLAYNAWTAIQQGTPPMWFYFAMGAIVLAVCAIALVGHRNAKETAAIIADLEKELLAMHVQDEDEDDDDDDDEDQEEDEK